MNTGMSPLFRPIPYLCASLANIVLPTSRGEIHNLEKRKREKRKRRIQEEKQREEDRQERMIQLMQQQQNQGGGGNSGQGAQLAWMQQSDKNWQRMPSQSGRGGNNGGSRYEPAPEPDQSGNPYAPPGGGGRGQGY